MFKFFAWFYFIMALISIGMGIYEQSWEIGLEAITYFFITSLCFLIVQQEKVIKIFIKSNELE